MAGLQRSSETFRRSGSSGLVWEDRFLSEEPKKAGEGGAELRHSRSVGSAGTLERNRSNGGGNGHGYRTGRVSPALDPPSPKLSGCGFCGIFGNKQQQAPARKKAKPGRR